MCHDGLHNIISPQSLWWKLGRISLPHFLPLPPLVAVSLLPTWPESEGAARSALEETGERGAATWLLTSQVFEVNFYIYSENVMSQLTHSHKSRRCKTDKCTSVALTWVIYPGELNLYMRSAPQNQRKWERVGFSAEGSPRDHALRTLLAWDRIVTVQQPVTYHVFVHECLCVFKLPFVFCSTEGLTFFCICFLSTSLGSKMSCSLLNDAGKGRELFKWFYSVRWEADNHHVTSQM